MLERYYFIDDISLLLYIFLIIVADISDVFVFIGKTIRESNFDSYYSLCGNHLGSVEDSGTLVIRCTEPTYGQYVSILLKGDEKEIAICEVYVFAYQGDLSWNHATLYIATYIYIHIYISLLHSEGWNLLALNYMAVLYLFGNSLKCNA